MNSTQLIGRLVNEPEMRFTQGGLAIMNLTMAVDRPLSREKREERKQKGETTADFPRVVLMGKTAELAAQYLKKGEQFSVSGRIRTSSYENAEGKMTYVTDIVCDRLQFLEFKKSGERQEGRGEATSTVYQAEDFDLEEVPF